jgi:DNA polymerase delta subunit 1
VDPVGGQARKKRTKDPRSGQWSEKDLAWEAPAVVTFGGHARRGGRPVRVFPEHDRADEFDTDAEARMILAFRALMVEYSDLDFLSGYNISGFDNDYLLKRADALGIGWQFRDFSRLREHPCDNPPKTFESKAWGKRETKELKCPGRVEYDTLRLVLRDMMMKLRSYTLDAVAQKVLAGAKKAAVSHEKITPWWLGEEATPATRRRVLEYNLLDSQLSWYIADTLAYFYTNEALARLTGVPFEFIFKNGQGVRTTSMLARKLAPQRKLIPSFSDEEKRALRRDYEGATVLDPRRGWYTSPLSTSDFAALYPSIMLVSRMRA